MEQGGAPEIFPEIFLTTADIVRAIAKIKWKALELFVISLT